MKMDNSLLILVNLSLTVLAAPYLPVSRYSGVRVGWEVCQYLVDEYGWEHEVTCMRGDRCVELPLVPHAFGVVATVTRRVLRKDTWEVLSGKFYQD